VAGTLRGALLLSTKTGRVRRTLRTLIACGLFSGREPAVAATNSTRIRPDRAALPTPPTCASATCACGACAAPRIARFARTRGALRRTAHAPQRAAFCAGPLALLPKHLPHTARSLSLTAYSLPPADAHHSLPYRHSNLPGRMIMVLCNHLLGILLPVPPPRNAYSLPYRGLQHRTRAQRIAYR